MNKIFDNMSWPPLWGWLIIGVILFKYIGDYLEDQPLNKNKGLTETELHIKQCAELSEGKDKEALIECLCKKEETIRYLEDHIYKYYKPNLSKSDFGYESMVLIHNIIDNNNSYCFDTTFINKIKRIRNSN